LKGKNVNIHLLDNKRINLFILFLRYLKLFGDKNELGNLRRKTSAKISSLFKGKEEKILKN